MTYVAEYALIARGKYKAKELTKLPISYGIQKIQKTFGFIQRLATKMKTEAAQHRGIGAQLLN